jgi:hypothetical protein
LFAWDESTVDRNLNMEWVLEYTDKLLFILLDGHLIKVLYKVHMEVFMGKIISPKNSLCFLHPPHLLVPTDLTISTVLPFPELYSQSHTV